LPDQARVRDPIRGSARIGRSASSPGQDPQLCGPCQRSRLRNHNAVVPDQVRTWDARRCSPAGCQARLVSSAKSGQNLVLSSASPEQKLQGLQCLIGMNGLIRHVVQGYETTNPQVAPTTTAAATAGHALTVANEERASGAVRKELLVALARVHNALQLQPAQCFRLHNVLQMRQI
jgi:hypothetical protein